MPIDPSIALGVRAPADPLNQLARVLQVQGLQKQAETADFEMGEKRRAIERQNKLYGLLADTAPDQLEPTLTRGGFLKEAGELGKQRRENVKLDAEAKAKEIEAASKRLDLAGQAFGSVRANPTPETAMAALDFLEQNKIYTPQQTAQYRAQITANPQSIAGLADQAFRAALSAKDQLPKYDTRNLGGTTETTAIDPVTGKLTVVNVAQNTQTPDNAASNARMAAEGEANRKVQIRGQDLVNKRATDQLAQQGWQYDAERGGRVNVKTGEFQPVVQGGQPIGAKPKPLTDAQAKANLFGTRMRESDRILNSIEGQYDPLAVNAKMAAAEVPLVGGLAGYAGNLALSKEGQMAEQAQRDFINAVLRRESGAVISPPEFANAKQQYFPQPGDSKEVLAQKRRNRALAIKGLEDEVPGGFKSSPTLTNPGSTGGAGGEWGIEKVK